MKRAVFVLGGLLVLGAAGLAVFVFGVQNVETPRYSTVLRDGIFEVRDYPSLVIAEVRRQGNREESLRRGFGPLARYIFAQERGGERIAMTAPVTQSRLDSGDWAVRFIMPARYRLDDLPAAASDVQLAQVPARRSAAIRFSGHTDDAVLTEKERELRAWMREQGLTPAAAAMFAYYNDPLTPGFLRRNEVLIEVIADSFSREPQARAAD
jgi:DNA gyrase inhibitor GyrI